MFRTFFIAAGVATLAFLTSANPVTAKTVFPIGGGSGDAAFADRCPANQYLTGLAGRAGNWIDRIQIICSQVLPNGTHGASYYGPERGGSGGAAQEYSCTPDSFATGAVLYWDDNNKRVTRVDLVCTSMQSKSQAILTFGGGLSATENLLIPSKELCPKNEFATGFAGRYGRDLNALGLFCDVPVTANAAPSGSPICPQGFVFRDASPADRVCVGYGERLTAARENREAAGHLSATDRTYGPNTCAQGYVWREAYSGDVVCVTPQQRAAAAEQNQNAPAPITAP